MKNTKRKGFTIVELVIVIAVIAILAAVLIPTFASLINKANRSADIQAVHQMNTLLATYTDGSVENISDAIKALDKENIDLDDYKALQTNHYFYFTVNEKTNTPMVIYVDANDEIVFPEVKKEDLGQWMSLSGDVPMDDGWEKNVNNGKVEISDAKQLADLMNKYSVDNSDATKVETIVLENNIDLKGAAVDFGKVESNITLQGKEGSNVTLSGLREDSNATTGTWDGQTKNYGYAIFGNVAKGVTVTVKNITVSNVVVENTKGNKVFGQSGVLFGTVAGTVNIENVTIESCAVVGGDKAASVIGYLSGTATLKNITVKDTEILGYGWAAKAVGYVVNSASLTIDTVNCDDVTVGINEADWSKCWVSGDRNWLEDRSVQRADAKTYDISADGLTYNKENIYLPYVQNSDENISNHYEGICTNDLCWVANWTKVTINNIEAGVPASTNVSYTPKGN